MILQYISVNLLFCVVMLCVGTCKYNLFLLDLVICMSGMHLMFFVLFFLSFVLHSQNFN